LLRKIIRAGKDVMTTKPFERDSAAAREILAEAAQSGRVIHLNSPSPRLPDDLATIRSWQKKYDLGRAVAVQASAWVRYNEVATGNWYDDPALCPSAPIFRIGIYLINDAVEFLGEAEEVQVLTSRLFTKRPTPDHAQLSIKFRNGGLASILASFCVGDGDPYRNSLTLNFERGTVYRNAGPEGRGGGECKLSLVVPSEPGCTVAESTQIYGVSGEYQWEDFHRAVKAGEVTSVEFAEKLCSSLKVVEAMALAERSGGTVKLAQ
jgi:predicted dehydrogenase